MIKSILKIISVIITIIGSLIAVITFAVPIIANFTDPSLTQMQLLQGYWQWYVIGLIALLVALISWVLSS